MVEAHTQQLVAASLAVLLDEPGPELHAAVRDAADLCPTGAITLEE